MNLRSLLLLSLVAAVPAFAAPVVDFSEDNSIGFDQALDGALEDKVLRQAFPHYVKDFEKCPNDARAAKTEVILSLVQSVRGSFTAPNANDLLLTFESVPCDQGHAGYHPNILLVKGDRLVAKSTDFASSRFHKVLDVEGDGALEVITSNSYSNQGYTGTQASTLSFRGGKIRELPFVKGNVHFDDCGLVEPGKEYNAVFFRQAKNPARTNQLNYVKPCGAGNDQYKLYSRGELDQSP